MVNTEKLLAYIEAAGTTWEEIARDAGHYPDTIQKFASTFANEATADDVLDLVVRLEIPACQVGLVFFAPECYKLDENGHPQPAELEDPEDVVADRMRDMQQPIKEEAAELFRIFCSLDVRSRHELMSAAFSIEERAGVAEGTATE